MVATISVRYDFGGVDTAPGTNQDIDDLGPPRLKFKLADNATIDEANKIIIPGAGLGPYYSYWKQLYLYCDANPAPVTTISNVKMYSDGSNGLGTGVDLMVGLQFPTRYYDAGAPAYTGYEVANNANEMVAEHGGITSSASIFNYTSTSPLSVSIEAAHQGSVINLAGETTNYIVFQMNVSNTAVPPVTGTEYIFWSYDEA